MVEADLQRELVSGLRSQGWWVWKWPDNAIGVVKPFDLCAAHDGAFHPIEVKLKKIVRQRPVEDDDVALDTRTAFQPHQVETLRTVRITGAAPYVAVGLAWQAPGTTRWKKWVWLVPFPALEELLVETNKITVGALNAHPAVQPLGWQVGTGWVL